MRLVGYVRVSRVAGREGDSFISPAVQRERIEKFASAQDHVIVGWQEDLDQPGSRYERPGFQAALEAVERGEADGIAVYALDRFARSVPDAAVALKRLEDAAGTLVSVRETLDTSTSVGKFARTMMLALAELELERIREGWADARGRAIGRGVHISRVPPVGYLRREDGRLVPDPVAGPVVREVFQRRAAGASWEELCELMDERLPREQGSWTHQTLTSIIGRRTYLGEAFQGEVRNPDAHEPLLSRAEWAAAQPRERGPRPRKSSVLLSGVIRCAGCGFTMSRLADGQRGYANYGCRKRHSAGICPSPARISIARADGFVERSFLDWVDEQRVAAQASPAQDALERALGRVDSAEAELAAYRDANLVSVIGQQAFVAGLQQRQRALDEARLVLEDARRSVPTLDVQELPSIWPTLTVAERRQLLAAAIDAVFVRRATVAGKAPFHDRLHILWRGEAPVDLPGRRFSELRPFVFPDQRPDVAGVTNS